MNFAASKNRKHYILDTNILMKSPYAIFAFDDNFVYITDITLNELDNNKNRPGEVGANVREVIRILDDLRKIGKLNDGVPISKGGEFAILITESREGKADDKIIAAVTKFNARREGTGLRPAILVTDDIAMRIKAELNGLAVQEYLTERVSEKRYTGRGDVFSSKEAIDRLYADRILAVEALIFDELDESVTQSLPDVVSSADDLTESQFLVVHDIENPKHTALARYDSSGCLRRLEYDRERPYGVSHRNVGQLFAQEALLAPVEEAPLVILQGPAGTAKTFYSLACGLHEVVENGRYRRILVVRPNVKFDEDIGYLKGSEEEKIAPLIRPVMDNLEDLCRLDASAKSEGDSKTVTYVDELFERDLISAQAMAYMRGRSVTDTWIIIDEAQNMTPLQAFGIISRAGRGSKIILAGDPNQIDNPRLDSRSNGLVFAAERMRGSSLCRQVTFYDSECVRSKLASEAILRLSPKGRK